MTLSPPERAPSSTSRSMAFSSGPRWLEPLAIALIAAILLGFLISFYDNTNRGTTNGLWKSIDVTPWVERAPDRKTEDSNLLYYPAVGAFVRLLPDSLGPVWRRMAFVNAMFASGVLALTYLIAFRLFESREAALFTSLSHAAMAFFLLLATINEDIMPGYAWFVAALACVVVPARPRVWHVALAAQCVALSWLLHSSLQLPAIGAALAGIIARTPDLRRASRLVGVFAASLIPVPFVSAAFVGVDASAAFWSAKGLGSGWGGFSSIKLMLMWSGIAQYVAGGQNIGDLETVLSTPRVIWISVTWVVVAVLGLVFTRECWRQRGQPHWRASAAVLGLAFVLGETMNLYVQPQDPQMQLQPMTWVPFAAGAAFWRARAAVHGWVSPLVARTVMPLAAAFLLAMNISAYADVRNGDSAALESVRRIETFVDPSRTAFLVHGFEGMNTWLTATWGKGAVWPNREAPEPLARTHRFHAIYIASQATEFPQRPPAEAANDVVRLVNRALDEGFDVVATDIWAAPEDEWVSSFATISSPDKPRAIRDALRRSFSGTHVGSVPGWGKFYRISRRAESEAGV
jgi:hypothetical protein